MTNTAFTRMTPGKKDALIAAAAREFAEHTFADSSLNRIIAACRMSKSSFYHVIDSKDQLLSLVVAELSARARADWSPPSPAEFAADFWTTAELLWRDTLDAWPHSEALNLLWRIVYGNRENEAVRRFHASVDDWLTEVLDTGRLNRAIDSSCPRELQAMAILSLLKTFDEWTLCVVQQETASTSEPSQEPTDPDEVERLSTHQFRLIRRLLQA